MQLIEGGQLSFLVREMERFAHVQARLSHNLSFWGGFWFLTIKRFFLLHKFMEETGGSDVLHVESDVLLLPEFPFEALIRLDCELAFPLVDDQHAAASVMYIKNFDAINKLVDYIDSDQLSHDDTDMKILAKYAKENSKVKVLPSIVECKTFESKTNELFEGIFDGATYGQYLFGLDPKNNLGRRTLFKPLYGHYAQAYAYSYKVVMKNRRYGLRVVNTDGGEYPIYNLHIHSKDLRAFELELERPQFLIQRCQQAKFGKVKIEFLPLVFLRNFSSILKYVPHLFLKTVKGKC